MTKAELIAALAKYPDDAVVLCDGYESGLDVIKIRESFARPQRYQRPWDGEFDECEKERGFPVVVLGRH